MNFSASNVILTYYPSFAGGKFVINCLSLSRHCIIADPRYAMQDLAYTIFDSDFYKFKLDAVLTTLPKIKDRNRWRAFEFREWIFAGIDNDDYGSKTADSIRNHKFKPELEKVVDSGRHHCMGSHYYPTTAGFKQVWPNAKIVSLVNWKRFVKLAGTFKASASEDVDKHLDYLLDFPSTLPWPSLIYDVDHSIFSRENHLRSIETMYTALGWDDFSADLVARYYDEYRYVHGF